MSVFIISLCAFGLLLKYLWNYFNFDSDYHDKFNSNSLFLYFLGISMVFNIIAYIIFDFSVNEGTSRYLVWIVIAASTFVGIYNFFDYSKFSIYEQILSLLVLFVLFIANGFYDSSKLKSYYPNLSYYEQIDKIVESSNSKLAIGGYWDGFNTTFNTQTHLEVAPYTQCQPYRYTSLDSMYKIKPDMIIVNRIRDKSWENCSDEDIENLFGVPTEIFKINDSEIWILKK